MKYILIPTLLFQLIAIAQESYMSKFELEDFNFNSEQSDFAPTFYGNDLVFASTRYKEKNDNVGTEGEEQLFFDLVVLEDIQTIKPFSKRINTRYHESTAIFTKDQKTIYFTRSNYTKRILRSDSVYTNHLKLYRGVLIDNKWKVTELPFNDDDYSIAHPALSSDEKTLFFVSDMPGTLGETDIYSIPIQGDNFGSIEHLSAPINTKFKETFPFLDENDNMYFSSNREGGLGNLDIYKAVSKNSSYDIEVLLNPINSEYDDITFIVNDKGEGYFSSNRNGQDDIFQFRKNLNYVENTLCNQIITGTVYGLNDNTHTVNVYNSKGDLIESTATDGSNIYRIERKLVCNESYILNIKFENGETKEVPFKSSAETAEVIIDFKNAGSFAELDVPSDEVVVKFERNTIHFSNDDYSIRSDASEILNSIVKTLNNNPSVIIEINSYTDSKGPESYNKILSQNRASSTRSYLISKGLSADRIRSYIGYGEQNLKNACDGSIYCNENEHEKNRRSEILIVK